MRLMVCFNKMTMVAWSDSFARQIKNNHDCIMATSTGF